MEEIKEKFLQDSIEPITLESTNIIISQMKKCVCKIHRGGIKGTGFFIKIPYKKDLLSVLITNNHVLGESDISNGKNISISLNNEEEFKNIIIHSQRKRYTNEILDVTIIEIFEEKDKIKDFLALDKQIIAQLNLKNNENTNYFNDIYNKESIYLLNYINGNKVCVSYGLLKNIEKNTINHKCSTDIGSSGSPILLLKNNCVIGVHHGSSKFNFNLGTLIIKPILEFQTISNNILIIKKENASNENDDSKNNNNLNNKIGNGIGFKYPPLIGLNNLGSTSYMNATLQCFCNIYKFADYFKSNKHLVDIVNKDKNNFKLCSSFKLLIGELWPDNYKHLGNIKAFSPEEFKNKISAMNPLFKGSDMKDPKDLIKFLIDTLHKELNKPDNNTIINSDMNLDERNQLLMFENFCKDFIANNRSIISDLFFGVKCNLKQCNCCKIQYFNYLTYSLLEFPLEEILAYKKESYNYSNSFAFNNNVINLLDCLNYKEKLNILTGKNQNFCKSCQKYTDFYMQSALWIGPEILIIILKQDKSFKSQAKIEIFENLDLFQFIEKKKAGYIYDLVGVINLIGNFGNRQFISYCRNPINYKWYKYKDSKVSEVVDLKREVIDYTNPYKDSDLAEPYVLFYQKLS